LSVPTRKQFKLTRSRHDAIFLFTDGVTEAMRAEERFFGERRLQEQLTPGEPKGDRRPGATRGVGLHRRRAARRTILRRCA